jgi:dihydrofolate reductase
MDLQSRKIEFIQEFLKLTSEEVVAKFERLLQKEKSALPNPFEEDEFVHRIQQSEADFQNQRYTTTEELLKKYQM